MVQRWCTLEGGYLSYYDDEKSGTPIGRVGVGEIVSLAINNTETMTGAGYDYLLLYESSYFPFLFTPFLFRSSSLSPFLHLFSLNRIVVFKPFVWVKNDQIHTNTKAFQ